MSEQEFRDRDETARDRDDLARGRDDLARDRDQYSQDRTTAARRVQTWATIVLIFLVAGLFYSGAQRQDSIEIIRESAARSEEVSTNIEEILVEIQTERFSEETQQFNAALRRAIRDIQDVREILCRVEAPPAPCQEEPEIGP